MKKIGIGILENDVWSARAISRWIDGRSPSFTVLWSCGSPAEVIYRCSFGDEIPDVLIVDMALGSVSGSDVCRKVRSVNSSIGIIGMTAYNPIEYIDDMAASGAQAMLGKDEIVAKMADLLPIVADGRSPSGMPFVSASQAYRRVMEGSGSSDSMAMLTDRELQVLRLYSQNLKTEEIAKKLGIRRSTVFTYAHRTNTKLCVKNRDEAIRLCKKYDLL